MSGNPRVSHIGLVAFASALASASIAEAADWRGLVTRYCFECHDSDAEEAGLDFEAALGVEVGANPAVWERAVRQWRAGLMPPAREARPDPDEAIGAALALEAELDAAAAARGAAPGRVPALRRLTRHEYANAVRDLLAVEIDPAELLPADAEGHGFDNTAVGELSTTLLERYLDAAGRIARSAVGGAPEGAELHTVRVPPDLTQEGHIEGLPPGTRGGVSIRHRFPADGEYEVRVRLARDRNEHVEGLARPARMELLLGGRELARFDLQPPRDAGGHEVADAHLAAKLRVEAGPAELGVAFAGAGPALEETLREPYQARFNYHRHPRRSPAVYQVTIHGPLGESSPGDTESRRIVFGPAASAGEGEAAARAALGPLMRRAYRRPVRADDFDAPLRLFREGVAEGGFEAGMEAALSAVLLGRDFLFRVESEPREVAPGMAYPIPDLELASRLSFFLWSSIPDEGLLGAAERAGLAERQGLERQARRMLEDPRSAALVENFAAQWLHLRNIDAARPDARQFPDFDHNLRRSMRRETEMHFERLLREDRPVIDLLRSGDTFVDARLAAHYGIKGVAGSQFRRVDLPPGARRGGLLRHAGLLTVTSYANRTSPVLRGNWVLENLLGTPPPPPPADVPALEEVSVDADLPLRERLASHRADPNCASCHAAMDPIGFALESYDATGRWRELEAGAPVDTRGGVPWREEPLFGVDALEGAIVANPELYYRTFAEKLLTYALGRGLTRADAPAVRAIVRGAEPGGYRFSEFVLGVVRSDAFTMREAAR